MHNGHSLSSGKNLRFFPHMFIPAPPEVPKVYMGARSGGQGHQSSQRAEARGSEPPPALLDPWQHPIQHWVQVMPFGPKPQPITAPGTQYHCCHTSAHQRWMENGKMFQLNDKSPLLFGSNLLLLLLLLSHFSRVQLCATPEMAAHQAPPSLGFSRQEHWSGLPFPSPMHESEK